MFLVLDIYFGKQRHGTDHEAFDHIRFEYNLVVKSKQLCIAIYTHTYVIIHVYIHIAVNK